MSLKTAFTFLLMLLAVGSAFAEIKVEAAAMEDIVGSWVRVGDGCRLLSEEELMNLGKNGGGNSSRRGMSLILMEDVFQARFMPSLRCEQGFQRKDAVEFGNKEVSADCEPAIVREGEMKLQQNGLMLTAKTCSDDYENPWGCSSIFPWVVKKIGAALVIHSSMDNDVCGQTPFYIYFIPIPQV